MPKISFIGAGSVVFTRHLLSDILSFPELSDCTLSLHDIDLVRLETAEAMARWIAKAMGASPQIEASLDRRASLAQADYVINLIQVGGHAATQVDFEIPRQYGLKQTIADTHGIGGIMRALRTIPVVLELAKDMEIECPQALLINYSNPMSMLCWSVFKSTQVNVVGLCHSVQGTARQMCQYAGIPFEEVTYLAAGINHMSWILRFQYAHRDAYPHLLQAYAEGRIPSTDLVRAELLRRVGYFVTESSEHMAEYLTYFIPHPELIVRFNVPIDEYLRRSESNLKEFEDTRGKLLRGESFEIKRSAEYAAQILHSMESGEPSVIYGNVRNTRLIENLPVDCCVEVPCLVDRNGIQPTHIGHLPPQLAGMILPHIAVQDLIVRSVLEGNRSFVYQAAMLDPLVSATLTLDDIWSMVDKLLTAHQLIIPEAFRTEVPDGPIGRPSPTVMVSPQP